MAHQLSWILPKLLSFPLYLCVYVLPFPLLFFIFFLSYPNSIFQRKNVRNYRFMEPIGVYSTTKSLSNHSHTMIRVGLTATVLLL